MLIRVPKVGNSNSIRLTTTMKRYLEVDGADPIVLDLDFKDGAIVIRKPRQMSFEEAKTRSQQQFDDALRNLAK
jgi:antitoxin component of MazEF toxin-antitoxin module